MKALIFGITGQDGAYLAQSLLAAGYTVSGVSRDADSQRPVNLESLGIAEQVVMFSLDTGNFEAVRNVIEECQPDEIYNLSGHSSVASSYKIPEQAFQSLTAGNINILESLRILPITHCRYFHASSGECFGETGIGSATEETPFSPKSPYAVAKAASHWMVKNYRDSYGIFACSAIMFTHESPLRSKEFVARKICAAAVEIKAGVRRNLQLGNTNVKRDWGWAEEYVEGVRQMLRQDTAQDMILSTGQSFTLENLVVEAFNRVDLEYQNYVQFSSDLLRPNEILNSAGSPNKARQLIDWDPQVTMPHVVAKLIDAEQQSI